MDPTLQKFHDIEAGIKEVRGAMLKLHKTFAQYKDDPDCEALFTMMYQKTTPKMDEHLKIMECAVQIQIEEFDTTKGMTRLEKGIHFLSRGLQIAE